MLCASYFGVLRTLCSMHQHHSRLQKMEPSQDWKFIESDQGLYTEMIKKFGVRGVQVEEVWALEEGIFDTLRPVHGLILLFKYFQDEKPSLPVVSDEGKIYFAKQVINNAGATQAIVNLLFNCNHLDIYLGPELTKLKEFCMSFDPTMRGATLSYCETIRNAHNDVSTPILFDTHLKGISMDEYHFVVYMPIHGRLYELDGFREGPIDHGPIGPEQDWLHVVRPGLLSRIRMYLDCGIRFNLMALISDRKLVYDRQIDELIEDTRAHRFEPYEVENQIRNLRMLMEYEDVKVEKYQYELTQRKYNYLPYVMGLVMVLAKLRRLLPLYEKAKERAEEKEA